MIALPLQEVGQRESPQPGVQQGKKVGLAKSNETLHSHAHLA